MKRVIVPAILVALVIGLWLGQQGAPPTGKRVRVSGEIIDSWCQTSGIMGPALGTAHHLCAIWCAVGGIPVGLMGDDGIVYILLKTDPTGVNVTNPTVLDMQSDHVVADAELFQRDGVNYLIINQMLMNDGIKNITHPDFGILPFGY